MKESQRNAHKIILLNTDLEIINMDIYYHMSVKSIYHGDMKENQQTHHCHVKKRPPKYINLRVSGRNTVFRIHMQHKLLFNSQMTMRMIISYLGSSRIRKDPEVDEWQSLRTFYSLLSWPA